MLIDSHAHLNDPRLFDIADEVVAEYRAAGVGAVVNAAYDLESARRGRLLARKYHDCYYTVGLHPHDAKLATPAMYDEMINLAADKKALAWGEIGLDYHYDLSPRETQKREFVKQLEIVCSLALPVVIHLREAYGDFDKLIKQNAHYLKHGILLHCYSGSAEAAKAYNSLDCYYSFGGAVTFAKHKDIVLRAVPKERLMLETDCPYMTPAPFRGRVNKPSLIYLVRDKIAELTGVTPEEVENITTKNAKRFYKRIN